MLDGEAIDRIPNLYWKHIDVQLYSEFNSKFSFEIFYIKIELLFEN